jgi:hypothetical protein
MTGLLHSLTTTTGMLGSPESPGYLAAKGKREEAVAVATKLWGPKGAAQLAESAGGWGQWASRLVGHP